MASVVSKVVKQLRSDAGLVGSVAAALASFAFVSKFFEAKTRSVYIYVASLASFLALLFMAYQRSRLKPSPRTRAAVRLGRLLVLCYLVLAFVALVPGVYRWLVKNTSFFDPRDRAPVEVGYAPFGLARASAQERVTTREELRVEAELDPDRTSLRCGGRRGNEAGEAPEVFLVSECTAFGLYGDRAKQLALGHQLVSPDRRLPYSTGTYPTARMKSVGRALEVVQGYRNTMHPLLEDSAKAVFMFTQSPEGKERLLKHGFLPTSAEWKRLDKDHPDLAHDLHWFIVDWVGVYDPFFKIRMINLSKEPITVATVRYTATYRTTKKASFIGIYDRPRYQLELEKGTHEENIHRAIAIPPNSAIETDWVFRLKEPRPGAVFSVALEFWTSDRQLSASLPEFTLFFFQGKEP
jgi:hypothetical protein